MMKSLTVVADLIDKRIAIGVCVVCGRPIAAAGKGPICPFCYAEFDRRRQIRDYVLDRVARGICRELENE